MSGLEGRFLTLIKDLEEEKRLADKRAKQLFDLASGGAGDKISEGDSSVEVVDVGTGYITTLADNQEVRRDKVLGNLQPLQPAFFAYNSVSDNNVTGTGQVVTVICDEEVFDQGNNYNPATGIFTAPVTGRYIFPLGLSLGDVVDQSWNMLNLITSNRTVNVLYFDHAYATSADAICRVGGSIIVDMDANDTAYIQVLCGGGSGQTVDIRGGASVQTWFSGALLC